MRSPKSFANSLLNCVIYCILIINCSTISLLSLEIASDNSCLSFYILNLEYHLSVQKLHEVIMKVIYQFPFRF